MKDLFYREVNTLNERLTEDFYDDMQKITRHCAKSDNIDLNTGGDDFQDIIDKLAEYEITEEDGRLVVLPCRVGDKVYQIISRYTECTPYGDTFDESYCCGCEEECDSHKVYEIIEIKAYTLENIAWNIRCENWGKNLFIDRDSAEKALKEMEKGNAAN